MVMRDGLVLPRVPFRPAHRIACILYSVQDKENGLLEGMIEPYRWPNLCRARVTPSWTSSKYSNCLHPPDKFMVLEKKSTIQKSFGKKIINSERNSKLLRVRFDVGSQWQAQQWVASADECTHTPSLPAQLGPVANIFFRGGQHTSLPQSSIKPSQQSQSCCTFSLLRQSCVSMEMSLFTLHPSL